MKKTFSSNASARDLQRNYKKLVSQIQETKQPVFLYSYSRPQAVLLSLEAYEQLTHKQTTTDTSKQSLDTIDEKEIDELVGLFGTENKSSKDLKKMILKEWESVD